jgi:hypothetical protein
VAIAARGLDPYDDAVQTPYVVELMVLNITKQRAQPRVSTRKLECQKRDEVLYVLYAYEKKLLTAEAM